MRIIIEFNPTIDCSYDEVNKYNIQSFIYSLLKKSKFSNLHDKVGFKLFNFSNIFPISDFKCGEHKKLIISSPDPEFIRTLYNQLITLKFFRLSNYQMEVININVIKPSCSNELITATPIVLLEENLNNKFISFQKNSFNSDLFFERLQDNAMKKYRAYTKKEIDPNFEIFDSLKFKREVSVRIKMHNKCFIMIGSLWKLKKYIEPEYKNFYNFIFDTGLGERNSLGFGFLNNAKVKKIKC